MSDKELRALLNHLRACDDAMEWLGNRSRKEDAAYAAAYYAAAAAASNSSAAYAAATAAYADIVRKMLAVPVEIGK